MLGPRGKVLATLAFVALAASTPPARPGWLAAEALTLAISIAIARVPIWQLCRRWAGFLAVFGFLTLLMIPGHPDRTRLGMWPLAGALVARGSLAFLAAATLAASVPTPALLDALGRLGVPRVLVSTLSFMARYMHVLADELGRMGRARRSREFRRGGIRGRLGAAGLLGVLFVRAMGRAERVHSAMLARGYGGVHPEPIEGHR